ncbi:MULTISPECIES: hypothetical protein [Nitrosomonas]|uniref:Uncharacterized protein n=1 Tax=Nitrosomonas eutropha TaxID=916 RepID=A0ABX5M6N8_9PROT|nr:MULTISPECIES: hypothetical protein [Nitrosomonas]MXS80904.1 hypothetical protein [Nitrosomonas sp. GH22]PXV76323.1 hypothetical protein C8R14_13325 [Nitrosomonas eutropha]SDW69448.1 hypothetical protein SAMN05216317_11066 [Nitrosomonas eutropha]SEJ18254.1 hypothetical protein SAMN05216318_1304 [Nitrosomonas eutropha]
MFPREIIIKNKGVEEKINFSDYRIPLSDRLFGALACAADAGWWILVACLKLAVIGLILNVSFLMAILQSARKANRRSR